MNKDLTLEYGDGTDAGYGCAATLKNEFWYFGGVHSYKRQVKLPKYLWDINSFYFRQAKLLVASWNLRQI